MKGAIFVSLLASIALPLPVAAQSGDETRSVPPFVALTVAVVDQSVTGGETAVIVWGPQENGTDHMIMLPDGRATAAELRKAAATLLELVRSGSSFEEGTWLRARTPLSDIGEYARSLQWVPKAVNDLKSAETRALAGVGDVPLVFVVVEVEW